MYLQAVSGKWRNLSEDCRSQREFRGFRRVDRIDTDDRRGFLEANTGSASVTNDPTLLQASVKVTTWFHSGATLVSGGGHASGRGRSGRMAYRTRLARARDRPASCPQLRCASTETD